MHVDTLLHATPPPMGINRWRTHAQPHWQVSLPAALLSCSWRSTRYDFLFTALMRRSRGTATGILCQGDHRTSHDGPWGPPTAAVPRCTGGEFYLHRCDHELASTTVLLLDPTTRALSRRGPAREENPEGHRTRTYFRTESRILYQVHTPPALDGSRARQGGSTYHSTFLAISP